MTQSLHLAVALNPGLLAPGDWIALVTEAERGLLDFVTIEDALGPPSRFDAVLLAALAAPRTSHIGLVPTVTTTHTEPFHVAIGIATLDHISGGRAGWRAQISPSSSEAAHFGRRSLPPVADLLEEAGDAVEVARRLWDSWEDDAEIRDLSTGRFIDRDKLHYIDFTGRWFSVKGPSITPRSPQGQPVVTASFPYEFAARSADVVYVTPTDGEHARAIVEEVRGLSDTLKIFADLVVFVGPDAGKRAEGFESDAAILAGSPDELADLLLDWQRAGIEGFRLRPGALPYDLEGITRGLSPALRARGAFRRAYEATTLRGLLGLPRPASRYAEVS